MKTNKINDGLLSKIFIYAILSGLAIVTVYPMLLIVSASFTENTALSYHGYRLIPSEFSIDAYKIIMLDIDRILRAYGVTFISTILGVAGSLLMSSMCGYAISSKKYKYRSLMSIYLFFTMLFSGGLVPSYILITRYLGLRNNILVLIIPMMAPPFMIFLLKIFFRDIPDALFESARIDGASEFGIFFRILLPLSAPGLATIGLIMALGYWNQWWQALLYIDNQRLYPLQMILQDIVANAVYLQEMLNKGIIAFSVDMSEIPRQGVIMGTCVVAAGPMLFIFMLFQKYFIRGINVGAVKG